VLLQSRSALHRYLFARSLFPFPSSLYAHHASQLESSNALLPFSTYFIPCGSLCLHHPPCSTPTSKHIVRTDATHLLGPSHNTPNLVTMVRSSLNSYCSNGRIPCPLRDIPFPSAAALQRHKVM
jgi:hypothetical protein